MKEVLCRIGEEEIVVEVQSSILLGVADKESEDSSWTTGSDSIQVYSVTAQRFAFWQILLSETLPENLTIAQNRN